MPFYRRLTKHWSLIFAELSFQEIAATVSGLPPEKLSELIDSFSDEEANTIQTLLDSENREEFTEVLGYADESAGRIMSHEYMAFYENISVEKAIKQFQEYGEDIDMPFVTTFIDIIGVSSYFLIAGSLLPV